MKKEKQAGIKDAQHKAAGSSSGDVAEVLLPDGRMGYECRNCGNELSVDSFNGCYCHWCGKKLRWEVPEGGRNNANHNYQRTVEI